MSLAGLPLEPIASRMASAVARQSPAMSRSTQRGRGIACGTRRRAIDSCRPAASKITALVTVKPLSIPSRLDMAVLLVGIYGTSSDLSGGAAIVLRRGAVFAAQEGRSPSVGARGELLSICFHRNNFLLVQLFSFQRK